MKVKLTKIQKLPARLELESYPVGTVVIGELDGVIEIGREISVRNWLKEQYFGSITKIGRITELPSNHSFMTMNGRWRWVEIEESPPEIIEKIEPPKVFESGLIIVDPLD